MSRHVGVGPDGSNLLGFLAALGASVVLDRALPDRRVRLSWEFHSGAWRPVWHVEGETTELELVDAIDRQLRVDGEPPGCDELGEDLGVTPEEFAAFAAKAARCAAPSARREADYVMAFGCEVTEVRSKGKMQIQDTAFRTMSGAGHQHFLGSMAELARLTTSDDILNALFRPWAYMDDRPSMRWDPADDRRYAYRADDPAKSRVYPIRTVRGANRLAVEALPLFPTVPRGRRLATSGFVQAEPAESGGGARWFVRWPIWRVDATVAVVRSLLTFPEITAREPDLWRLNEMGVVELFEAERVTEGQYRSFTPARALMGSWTGPLRS